jgi:hypothetical protein
MVTSKGSLASGVRLWTLFSYLLLLPLTTLAKPSNSNPLKALLPNALTKARKCVNLSGLFGSRTDVNPFDRVAGHPVFAVTTPWGSPYMNMEKLSDLDETVPTVPLDSKKRSKSNPQSISEEQNEYRTVALFFLDPDDALGVHTEMKQMDNMKKADLRLTAFSLSKALRQASNLGNGLLTGLPADPLDGTFKYEDGASLRYKIVPPKRQLYYAARCVGRERVGLMSENAADDAQAAVLGNSALEGMNLIRRREKRERKTPKGPSSMSPMQLANQHMDGYTGIPVFHEPQMVRKVSVVKRLVSGTQNEVPFFFNYEDLVDAWTRMRNKARFKSRIPERPPDVEVFNLWDLLTSMDKDAAQRSDAKRRNPKELVLDPLRKRFLSRPENDPDLDQIVFVPSSRSVQYKEAMSARGNGKCRLRPMR